MADTDKMYTSVAAEKKKMQLLKGELDAIMENEINPVKEKLSGAAFLKDEEQTAVIAGFDAQTDTVWKKAQTLSSAEKARVKQNLGLDVDLRLLQELYDTLVTGNGILPVEADSWPVEEPQEKIIYRVQGTTSYADYMYDGINMIKMAEYDNMLDDVPTPGNSNPISSNGVALHGAALDVSVINKAQNNLATYADLSEAIAAIPTEYRTGGMTIKFVRSFDNKYIQYQLPKNEWSDYSADWISDEKTASLAHKDDYVKYNGFSSAGHSSIANTNLSIDEQGKIKNESEQASYVVLLKNPFKKGDIIHFEGVATANRAVKLCFSREDLTALVKADLVGKQLVGNPESGFASYFTGTNHNWDIVIPEDGLYVVIYVYQGNWQSQSWYIYTHVVDNEPTAGSEDLVKSGGVANKGMLYHFVGNGNSYVMSQCGKIIAGHTYRIYPISKEWPWGTTQSAVTVLDIRYKDSNGDYVTVLNIYYGTGSPSIPDYVDVLIPSNILVGSGLYIGGRTTSGNKVYFTIEDITFAKDNISRIDAELEDYSLVKKAVVDVCYFQNYIDNKSINSTGSIVDNTNYFMSVHIPAKKGDVIKWCYANARSLQASTNVYDSEDNKLTNWSANNENGVREFTISNDAADYIVCCFVKDDGYVPAVYVNGQLAWNKHENGEVFELGTRVSALEAYNISGLEKRVDDLDNIQNYIDNKGITSAGNIVDNSSYFMSVHIPAKQYDVVRWCYANGKSLSASTRICDAEGNKITQWSANNSSGERTFTISNATADYIECCFKKEEGYTPAVYLNGQLVWTKQENGSVPKLEVRVAALENEVSPNRDIYGEIGKNYPKQIDDIVSKLSYRFANRFHFIHLSDNHNVDYGYANELLDFVPAKFLVNTGDMVNDKFSDSKATTIACSISPTKPVYLVLGNHDYAHATTKQAVFDAFFGSAETDGTVNYHNAQNGGLAVDKTYYSIDFATEGVKCIMLDINEGQDDADLPDLSPSAATYGKMSQTQIEWFVGQLQDAITNDFHVCVFIHALPSREQPVFGQVIDSFLDKNYDGYRPLYGNSLETCYRLSFLLDIVNAFINGSSVTFTYLEHDYSFTFASAGHFVAWFAGHTHYDAIGWLKNYENQFAINVCRPTPNSGGSLGTYDGDKLGVHFNYVTIDKALKSLSVYRVGQQDTVYATQRKSFRILYK